MCRDAPDMGCVAVFEQIDTLPCAQHHHPGLHGDRQAGGQHCRLDMGWHVIRPLEGMGKIRHRRIIAARDGSAKERQQVALNIRIGIFLN